MKILGLVVGLLVLGLSWPAYTLYQELGKVGSEDPLVWEENIAALEAATTGRFGPDEAVVFVGSSSIRFWQTLADDMAPIPVIQHGFGGAKLNDVVHYAARLVNNYAPHAVVIFAGTNDITPQASKTPARLLASYQEFVRTVRTEQSTLPIFYIDITPSPLRWEVWPVAQDANRMIEAWSNTDANLYFITTGPSLLGPDGAPLPDNYVYDGLHLSEQGYALWAAIIKQRLLDDLERF